ncbi:diguanylate cyclase [Dactylosporangium sp. NPDC049140]|uniref:diguanylate cyclase n=1 Tax=Dactylosporangium sp. NPDC049140 TaxID=3155647 RepID=UPI0033FFFB34
MGEGLLYQSARTRVLRISAGAAGATAIRKEYRGPGAAERRRHELTIVRRLAGVSGVPQLLPEPDGREATLLADSGGTSLVASLAEAPMDVPELLDFTIELISVVAGVHRRGVVHKDINPANIIVVRSGSGQRRHPVLVDFDLASTSAEERPGFSHLRDVMGTLAYIAPEQTGRTGWPVDQRADLYALGSTLYELATGSPPFGHNDDPLELTHDQLTRVPVPPSQINPKVPAAFSAIVGHLLEKEPDRRYQSAEGVLHDLRRLRDAYPAAADGTFTPGRRDFPLRLPPPTRLVGRTPEIELLRQCFRESVAGRCPGALVCGQPGVGKTSLVDQLRPMVTAAGGWFVSGKFDQFRQGGTADAVRQAMRALARMLLAEPEDRLAVIRERLREALGADIGLVTTDPEFEALLGRPPEVAVADPRTAQARLNQACLAALKALASTARPIVVVIDDLQWAGPASVGFVDAVLSSGGLPGVLLVCAYREAEVNDAHPLSAALPRWRDQGRPPVAVRLANLGSADVCELLGELLRLPARDADAGSLAEVVRERTDGNPFDTVELVNALRREGTLIPGEDGWTWDPAALRRHVGRSDVLELIGARIAALPGRTRELMSAMACLGDEVEFDVLRAAASDTADAELDDLRGVAGPLAPALEGGLLVAEHGAATSVRFRHDRVRQAAYAGMTPAGRRARHLALARNLVRHPEYAAVAAEQYLPAAGEVTDEHERRLVVELLTVTAGRARLLANFDLTERYLSAADSLLAADPAADDDLRQRLEIERHTALFGLGRLEEADELYARVAPTVDPVQRSQLTVIQISSLAHRARAQEAVDLGVGLLADLGHPPPAPHDLPAEIDRGIEELRVWAETGSADDDLRRPDNEDPRVAAVAGVIYRLIPPSFFCASPLMPWFVTEARRLWAEGGPCADLVGALAHAAYVSIGLRDDYPTAYAAVRRVLKVSQARGYDPASGQAEFLFSISTAPWFETLEEGIRHALHAREALLRGGDLYHACFTYYASIPQMLDCGPRLEDVVAEAETGLAFAARIGNHWGATTMIGWAQAARALRGATAAWGSLDDAGFDTEERYAAFAGNPIAAVNLCAAHAMVAAVFGDQDTLFERSAVAIPLLPFVTTTQTTTLVFLTRGLALAGRIRSAEASQRPALLAEFDDCRAWLAARAADCPPTFLHLRHLLEAERAWALGETVNALRAFDAARHEVSALQRPWHRAYIAERLAMFQFAEDMEHAGRATLREALHHYGEWGAAGKTAQLERDYPFLLERQEIPAATVPVSLDSSHLSADAIDMLAVVRASQALSSETTLAGLQSQVSEILAALTGATGVRMVFRDVDVGRWVIPGPAGDDMLAAEEAAEAGLLPMSALHYAERTREALLVEDATRDDRFSRDPYLRDLPACSLLVVPIVSRGELRAMLLLESRSIRGAFGSSRLDAVELIAGQLSVSLDNAMLYAALERKVAERTVALQAANDELKTLAVTDPLTGLANRRRLNETLDAEWRGSRRLGVPISVVLLDIDHFKKYNDHYGHLHGDECLRRVADAISRSVRGTDIVARFGGEEFAVVLPRTDSATAAGVAERIRTTVLALAEAHCQTDLGIVSVSVGHATALPNRMDSHEHLIKLADAALYEAKRAGRNRVVGADQFAADAGSSGVA